MKSVPCALALLLTAALTPVIAARDSDESLLVFGPAVANVLYPDRSAMACVEYRYTTGRYHPGPWLALEATGRDLFVGFGLFLDRPLGRRFMFTPSAGMAIYQEHDGLGLGSPLEFRAAGELTYRLARWRFGASFEHYSNATLSDSNPGTEIVRVLWVVPLDRSGSPHGGSGLRGLPSAP